jgi:hypothetical protein
MQMLSAGGHPMSGEYPVFENEYGSSMLDNRLTEEMMWQIDGRAVKLLDPQRGTIPKGPEYRAIWCSRDPKEQARSQAKFLRILAGVNVSREEVRALAKSYDKDKAPALQCLLASGMTGADILSVRFERVLSNPWEISEQIRAHCKMPLDIDKMAAVVIQRSPACAPGLDLEMRLIGQRRNARHVDNSAIEG